MSIARTTTRLPLIAALLLLLGGCSAHRQTFAGHDSNEVWTAMLAVAEVPDYTGDWHVTDNIVTSDRSAGRIDVNRDLRRSVREADGSWRTEQRTWQFRYELLPGTPPTVTMIARNPAIPMHVLSEANRFFTDVGAVLAGVPRPVPADQPQFAVPDDPDAGRPGEPRDVDRR